MRVCALPLLLVACSGPATLTDVQTDVFDRSCGFSSCHGSTAGAGELDLTAGHAHASLVGVVPAGVDNTDPDLPAGVDVSGEILVIPGDPDNSYLMKKLAGADGINGAAMPEGSPPIDPKLVDEIASWIEAGAADD